MVKKDDWMNRKNGEKPLGAGGSSFEMIDRAALFMDGPPGPPASVRLVPEQVAQTVLPFGFTGKSFRDLGAHHYLATFLRSGLEKT